MGAGWVATIGGERRSRAAAGPPRAQLRVVARDGSAEEAPLRVVVADDSPAVRAMLVALLRAEPGFVVAAEAANGADALQAVASVAVDVLLLDLSMPELDGLEVLERLGKSQPALRVAIYSGHSAPGVERRARELGAADFILKGTDPEELVTRLRRIAGRR